LSGNDLSLLEGSIALTLLNVYSTLLLKTRLSSVVFDPVKLNPHKLPFDVQAIDTIVITHEHADHFDKELVLEMRRRSKAQILTTPFVAQKLGGERVRGLGVGESVKIKDLTFYTESCVHPANQPLAFIIKTDIVTIYYPVDSEPFAAMKEIKSRYEPDIMICIEASKGDLLEIAEMVKPKIVISYFATGFADIGIPGVEMKMLRQFETFRYP